MHPIPRTTRRAPGLGPKQRCDVALAAVGIAAITAVGIPAWAAVGGTPVAATAQAPSTPSTPELMSVDVQLVPRVQPGAGLAFSVRATPGMRVRVCIDGASQPLRLSETSPGLYQGTYVAAERDRIGSHSQLAAKLRHDSGMSTALLKRTLQTARTPTAAAGVNRIDSVTASAEPGRTIALRVLVRGSLGGRAQLRLPLQQVPTGWMQEGRQGLHSAPLRLPVVELDREQALVARLSTGQGSMLMTMQHAFGLKRSTLLTKAQRQGTPFGASGGSSAAVVDAYGAHFAPTLIPSHPRVVRRHGMSDLPVALT